jgi:toluene monooxygenase system protein E
VSFLDRWYSPLRFPVHGLQMLASYIAQMAPASRITNCAAFQATDEMRRVQRIAYRTVQLTGAPFDAETAGRQQAAWEDAAAFQPLRKLIERALIAYDWGEALTVTNLVIKPVIDRFINQEIAGALATANRDPILTSIHFSLDEDARWHRAWTAALLSHLIDDTPANAELVSGWIEKWRPLATDALEAYAGIVTEAPVPLDPGALVGRITADVTTETDVLMKASD